MNDLLIKRAQPNATAIVAAVSNEDRDQVADILTTLSRDELYALTIVLASYADITPLDTPAGIIKAAIRFSAEAFSVVTEDIHSRNKQTPVLDARAVACYAAHLAGASYSEIGRRLDRDHSTVMNACGRVAESGRLRRIAHRVAERLGWDREDVA